MKKILTIQKRLNKTNNNSNKNNNNDIKLLDGVDKVNFNTIKSNKQRRGKNVG